MAIHANITKTAERLSQETAAFHEMEPGLRDIPRGLMAIIDITDGMSDDPRSEAIIWAANQLHGQAVALIKLYYTAYGTPECAVQS
jgi:hypothetical protein